MSDVIVMLLTDALRDAVVSGAVTMEDLPEVTLERPKDLSHGDWASNVAMRAAKAAGMAPRDVAAAIVANVASHPDVEAVEIAGPGFINIRLSRAPIQRVVREIREAGEGYGRSTFGGGRKVQVEFVSANPVGPMHVGHGRWAALGDSIARLLEHTGHTVEREFYVNDAGVQMDIFARSVAARYLEECGREVEFGEDWYRGAYIADIAQEIRAAEGDAWADADPGEREAHFMEKAYAQVLAHLRGVLHGIGVDFDVWFSERSLHAPGPDGSTAVEAAIAVLRGAGHVFEEDGAVWFRSTDFGDDKDRVLRKADGSYTYFAADVAYHRDKFARGFDLVIDLWGADHHGYVKRMEAAAAALGHPGGLEVVIGQLVNLFRDGEAVRMSKRTGEMVTFEELLDEVGADAARYFFLRRSTDQSLDFDIGLATRNTADNPVYYVQYAHARICSILRKAGSVPAEVDLALLDGEAELTLLRKLGEFSEVVEAAALARAPHRLTRYAEELAAVFHQFYTVCRVVTGDAALSGARLAAVDATRIVLERALALVGVSAPERM